MALVPKKVRIWRSQNGPLMMDVLTMHYLWDFKLWQSLRLSVKEKMFLEPLTRRSATVVVFKFRVMRFYPLDLGVNIKSPLSSQQMDESFYSSCVLKAGSGFVTCAVLIISAVPFPLGTVPKV